VLAETPVRALVIGGQEFDRVLDQHPRILRVLCAVVSERLREADRNLSGQDDAFTKVAEILARYVDDFGSTGERDIQVGIGSQAVLGESLGLSRESVVRALKRLRELDIVATVRGIVTVRDLDALRKIAAR
jgi:CRP-like cAMP-binding protein